jgi:hypothetical protein
MTPISVLGQGDGTAKAYAQAAVALDAPTAAYAAGVAVSEAEPLLTRSGETADLSEDAARLLSQGKFTQVAALCARCEFAPVLPRKPVHGAALARPDAANDEGSGKRFFSGKVDARIFLKLLPHFVDRSACVFELHEFVDPLAIPGKGSTYEMSSFEFVRKADLGLFAA